jgi:hypothetical protein
MSRLITALGVICAVCFAVAPELGSIDPKLSRYFMLVGVGAAALGKALVSPSRMPSFPRRGMFASRRTLKSLVAVGVAGLLAISAACKSETVRGVSAGIAAGAGVFRTEVEAGVASGDITADEADFLNPLIDEVESAASDIAARADGWDSMTARERRALALDAVEKIGGAVQRLSARGVGVKSERGRARINKYMGHARRAVGVLRVVEAATSRKGD